MEQLWQKVLIHTPSLHLVGFPTRSAETYDILSSWMRPGISYSDLQDWEKHLLKSSGTTCLYNMKYTVEKL